MNLFINAVLNSYSILILIIILFYSISRTKDLTLEFKLFNAIVITTIVLLVFDILGRLEGFELTFPILHDIGNFMLFAAHFILPSLWFIYVYYQLNHDKTKLKMPAIVLIIINIAAIIVTIINLEAGWLYYIDDMHIYHRGELFVLFPFITLAMLCFTCIYVLFNEKKVYAPLVLFSLPPIIGMAMHMIIDDVSLVLNSVALSVLIVFLGIQNKIIHTDYLTDFGNRTKFENVLRDKVDVATHKHTFSLVMVDITDFRSINDEHGYTLGDEALKTTANLLKECTRSRDYMFRYGADEFCMILDISDKYDLERLVLRIGRHVKKFNETNALPFDLSLSLGFAVYNSKETMSAVEFLKYVELMVAEENLTEHSYVIK